MLADQHATVVKLTNPLDALNVATFIAYIVLVHAPQMRDLFSQDLPADSELRTRYLPAHARERSPYERAIQLTLAEAKAKVPIPYYKSPRAREAEAFEAESVVNATVG